MCALMRQVTLTVPGESAPIARHLRAGRASNKSYTCESLGCPPLYQRSGRLHNEVEVSMALISRAARARRRPRASWARAASAAGVIALAAAVAACGNGNSSGASTAGSPGGTKDGFKQAAQTSGT